MPTGRALLVKVAVPWLSSVMLPGKPRSVTEPVGVAGPVRPAGGATVTVTVTAWPETLGLGPLSVTVTTGVAG